MRFTIPPGIRVAGDPGFPAEIDQAYTALAVIAGVNVLNTAYAGGADPTGATDSTAALQAALNAVPAGGGTVYIPPGSYKITATLNPAVSGTILAGGGWGSQIVYDGSLISPAIGMADTTERVVHIRDLRISQTHSSAAGTAISANYFVDSALERLLVDAATGGKPPNIGIDHNQTSTFYNVISDSRIFCDGTNGIAVRFDSGANSHVVRNCRILPSASDATQKGVYLGSAHSVCVDHVDIEAAAGIGIHVSANAHDTTIIAPYLESNGTNLQIDSGARGTAIIGGYNAIAGTANLTDNGIATSYIGGRVGTWPFTKLPLPAGVDPLAPSGALGETFSRQLATATATALSQGTVYIVAIPLQAGVTVSNITVYTAAGTVVTQANLTHGWLALLDAGRTVRAVSADQINVPFLTAINTAYPLSMVTPYVTTTTGLHYLAISVSTSAGSQPQLLQRSGSIGTGVGPVAPVLQGTCGTQAAPPATGTGMGAVTFSNVAPFYGWVS